MSFPEWGAGGSGLWSEPASSLGFHSACTCVFVCGLFLQLLNSNRSYTVWVCWRSAECELFSLNFHRSVPLSRRLFAPGFPIGTCMKWASLRRLCIRSQSAPLLATRWRRGVAFIHSICVQVWSFLCKVYALKLSERSTSWDSAAPLGAQFGLLRRWQRVLFTLPILLLFFLLIVVIRIVHQSH